MVKGGIDGRWERSMLIAKNLPDSGIKDGFPKISFVEECLAVSKQTIPPAADGMALSQLLPL
jgi:hypothetical protein